MGAAYQAQTNNSYTNGLTLASPSMSANELGVVAVGLTTASSSGAVGTLTWDGTDMLPADVESNIGTATQGRSTLAHIINPSTGSTNVIMDTAPNRDGAMFVIRISGASSVEADIVVQTNKGNDGASPAQISLSNVVASSICISCHTTDSRTISGVQDNATVIALNGRQGSAYSQALSGSITHGYTWSGGAEDSGQVIAEYAGGASAGKRALWIFSQMSDVLRQLRGGLSLPLDFPDWYRELINNPLRPTVVEVRCGIIRPRGIEWVS